MTYENGEARKNGEVCPPGRALILMSKKDADLSDRLATRLRQYGLFVGQTYDMTSGKTYLMYNDVSVLVLGEGYEPAVSCMKIAENISKYVQDGSRLKRYEPAKKPTTVCPGICSLENIATAPC
ncbi:MAG: hypothetical protein V1729_06215 [Candidatus Woesearchaeota archaeon]